MAKHRPFTIAKRELRRLQDRALRAQQRDQSEVCGALLLFEDNHLLIEFIENVHDGPMSFAISPEGAKTARRKALNSGFRIGGWFHSHPISEAIPSKADIDQAPTNCLMLIYDVCGREYRLWRIVRDGIGKTASERVLIVRG